MHRLAIAALCALLFSCARAQPNLHTDADDLGETGDVGQSDDAGHDGQDDSAVESDVSGDLDIDTPQDRGVDQQTPDLGDDGALDLRPDPDLTDPPDSADDTTDTPDTNDSPDTADDPDLADESDPDLGILPTGGDLIISEIVDHGQRADARYVEIWNASGAAQNLLGWTLEFYANSNEGPTPSEIFTFPDVVLANGDTFVIGKNAAIFGDEYGFAPDAESDIANGSGDDTLRLVGFGVPRDIYGEIGVDGSFLDWGYTDAVTTRVPGAINGQTTWQVDEWVIGEPQDTDPATPGWHEYP